MDIKQTRINMKASGDRHIMELEAIATDDQLVRLTAALTETDRTHDAVLDHFRAGYYHWKIQNRDK